MTYYVSWEIDSACISCKKIFYVGYFTIRFLKPIHLKTRVFNYAASKAPTSSVVENAKKSKQEIMESKCLIRSGRLDKEKLPE